MTLKRGFLLWAQFGDDWIDGQIDGLVQMHMHEDANLPHAFVNFSDGDRMWFPIKPRHWCENTAGAITFPDDSLAAFASHVAKHGFTSKLTLLRDTTKDDRIRSCTVWELGYGGVGCVCA